MHGAKNSFIGGNKESLILYTVRLVITNSRLLRIHVCNEQNIAEFLDLNDKLPFKFLRLKQNKMDSRREFVITYFECMLLIANRINKGILGLVN